MHCPSAKSLYDLFMGGAIAHCAFESGKYKNIVANDINPLTTRLFQNAINGKYKNENRWISREGFFGLKDTDEYVSIVWLFGNDMRNYMYGRNIERWKKALHYAVCFDDCSLLNSESVFPPSISEKNTYKRRVIL